MQSVRSNWGAFLFLFFASAMMGWSPLFKTFRIAATDGQYTQILLVLPVSFALIWVDRKWLPAPLRPSIGYGFTILGFAVLIALLSRAWSTRMTADVHLAAQMLALVTFWVGSFVVCFGIGASRFLAFPLSFVLFL